MEKTDDKRITAFEWPQLVNSKTIGEHLVLHSQDTTVCGKNLDDYGLYGGDLSKCACKKCIRIFWEKYNAIKDVSSEVNLYECKKFRRKIYRFCQKAPFVEKIEFKYLKTGDVFYMEEYNGELVFDESDEDFLFVALDNSKVCGVNKRFILTNWVITYRDVIKFRKMFKTAIQDTQLITSDKRDCDTCKHDGDCMITVLKCKGYSKQK